jgi:hypothetical protein
MNISGLIRALIALAIGGAGIYLTVQDYGPEFFSKLELNTVHVGLWAALIFLLVDKFNKAKGG